MAKIKVWVLTCCVPHECEPCFPQVFGTYEAANVAFAEAMRSEWECNGACNDETGEQLPCPDDPQEAHDIMADFGRGEWGQWELTEHTIETGVVLRTTEEDDNPFHSESPEGRAWDAGDRSSIS